MKEEEFESLLKITRIKLTPKERSSIKKDIDEILNYFDKIDRMKVEIEPAYQPIDVPTRMRKDIVKKFNEVNLLIKETDTYNSYVLGPKL
jgi:aspartyl/glutamyl-tRNA(Asn/Gln) amidotransferase C subunit